MATSSRSSALRQLNFFLLGSRWDSQKTWHIATGAVYLIKIDQVFVFAKEWVELIGGHTFIAAKPYKANGSPNRSVNKKAHRDTNHTRIAVFLLFTVALGLLKLFSLCRPATCWLQEHVARPFDFGLVLGRGPFKSDAVCFGLWFWQVLDVLQVGCEIQFLEPNLTWKDLSVP